MKRLMCFAIVGTVVWAAAGYAQESKRKPLKADVVKATYLAKGLH